MRTYIIKTNHEIEVDEFDNGLTKYVNSYNMKEEIKADNTIQAIQKYFESVLYYNFDIEKAYIFHHEDENDKPNILAYDVLVNEETNEATETEKEQWSFFNKTLYNNRIYLQIHELKPVKIE